MRSFDPDSAAAEGSGIFGLPFTEKESALVLLPVPWEATASYGKGTAKGPAAVLAASRQIDLFDPEVEKPYEPGIFMRPERLWSRKASGDELNAWVRGQAKALMGRGKIAGIVGGEHSVPFGAFQAAAETFGSYGLLHFDAHSDTRDAYEGFQWSHASIMRNAMERIPRIEKLLQVGIRDYCGQEEAFLRGLGKRAEVFFSHELARRRFVGKPFADTAKEIVSRLPKQVWVSFDIDALDPSLCPHTGTPVPGGLGFEEACFILSTLARSGRRILGFDLVEVAPAPGGKDEWDANVGMRILYKLAAWTFVSRGLRKPR
ncbi:MAG: agmatinase family protein [Elusimicrobiota bacterium]